MELGFTLRARMPPPPPTVSKPHPTGLSTGPPGHKMYSMQCMENECGESGDEKE